MVSSCQMFGRSKVHEKSNAKKQFNANYGTVYGQMSDDAKTA